MMWRKDRSDLPPLNLQNMGRTFLQESAELIVERHGKHLEDVCIVVPGKRAGVYLRKELARILATPFIAPRIFTLPAFLEWGSGEILNSKTALLFQLYAAYESVTPQPESFHSFLKWGTTILDDFQDLDHTLTDPVAFFRELKNIRDIEHWSFSIEPLSPSQQSYSVFWDSLGPLYHAFHDRFIGGERSYASLARSLALGEVSLDVRLNSTFTWFVGLSSLTPAEERIVDALRESKKAVCLWDSDSWYIENEMHEAGAFFRKRLEKEDFKIPNHLAEGNLQLRIHQCTTSFGQVWAAHNRLAAMTKEQLERSVVVVTDDSLVHTLLRGLPELPCTVNVAMGMPLRNDPLFRLIHDLLLYHRQLSRESSHGVYHIHFMRLLSSPLWEILTGESSQKCRDWITKGIKIYLRPTDITEFNVAFPGASSFSISWLTAPLSASQFVGEAITLINFIFDQSAKNPLQREVAHKLHKILQDVQAYVQTHSFLRDIASLNAVFQQLIGSETIAYGGEPLAGMQVLSMVETRAIDFDHVIVIGANEDQLPGGGHYQSLIPFDLRQFHGLPLPSDRDSTYSYTFYRLIQRASQVDLYFASIIADLKGSEQSRYITQLELELPKLAPRAHITRDRIVSPSPQKAAHHNAFPQTEFSRTRLLEWMKSGISPSAIGAYLRCPLDFYYKYILGIRELEELEEQMSEATFGDTVHQVMERFLSEFVGGFPETTDWQQFRESVDTRIGNVLTEKHPGHQHEFGFNRIQLEIMRDMILRLIDFEIEEHKNLIDRGAIHRIHSVEEVLSAELPASSYNWPVEIRMRGKADRVDEIDDHVRIIDYKTGSVKSSNVSAGKSPDEWFTENKEKLIQILSYAYMYCSAGHDPARTDAALLSLRAVSEGYHSMEALKSAFPDWKNLFEEQLVLFLKSIYDSDQFEHNSNSRYCEFCGPV